MVRASVSTLAVILLLAACGGEQPPAAAPPTAAPTATTPPAASAPPTPSASAAAAPSAPPAASVAPPEPPGPGQWDTWSHDQKLAYMKNAVMPKMGPMFRDYDPKRFGETRCTLCHGAGAKDGSFKMPNPSLPKLLATPEGFNKLAAEQPKAVEFMSKQVVPTMASLLGEQPYDPKTQKGFGCFKCHTKKM